MQKQPLDFSSVKKLVVKSIDSDVQIDVSKTGEYFVVGSEKDLLIDRKNDTVEISTRGRFILPMIHYDSSPISVSIPPQLNEILVTSVSGDVKVNSVKASKLSFKTTSGEFTCDSINCDFCEIRTISGDISLSQPNTRRLVITTISGDIEIKGVVPGDYDWVISSVSADVELETVGVPNMRVTFRTASGDLTSNIGYTREGREYLFGDGRMKVVVSTTSGDLTIKATNRAERAEDIEKKILRLVAEGKLSYEQAREILKELL